MNNAREKIYAALFALLGAAADFETASRTLKGWDDPAPQPALYQVQSGERADAEFVGAPLRWTLSVRVFVYAKGDGSSDNVPSQALNPLIDAIEAAVQPGPGLEPQTLGGLVESCWIEGNVQIFEGVLGDQAVAIVPISVLTHA